jgi:hypothetical protein
VREDQKSNRIAETRVLLQKLGLPPDQCNARAALVLLAFLDLTPDQPWSAATAPLRGVTPAMGFVELHYGVQWAPNTRETVRRGTIHQFVEATLLVPNPDLPTRAVNSPHYCYQVRPEVLALLRLFGSAAWETKLGVFRATERTLAERYRQRRSLPHVGVSLPDGQNIKLTPGGHNQLVREVLERFAPRFTPGARVVYVGDTGEKWAHFDRSLLASLGVELDPHGKMPDVVLFHERENWLVLVEAVTSHGPVSPKRLTELRSLFAASKLGLVFVTSFLQRKHLFRFLRDVAWETEVWIAEDPDHLIHFDGQRFLGPY